MKHTSKFSASKQLKTILSLVLAMSLLLSCSLMFAGCAKTESTDNNAETPDAPIVEEVVDIRNDPAQYEGLQEAALLRKLATNNLKFYMTAMPEPISTGKKVDMNLTVGNTILDLLEESMGEGADLSFLQNIRMTLDVGQADNSAKLAMAVGLNGKTVVTLNMLMNMAENVMYMGIPELSDAWIEMDMSQMMGPVEEGMASIPTDRLTQLMNALPDAETLANLLDRYANIALAELNNVTQTTETLSVGGITQDVTALTLKIYEADAMKAVKAVITEAKDDAEIKGIIESLAGENGEQMYAQFQEIINNLLSTFDEHFAEAEANKDEYIQLVTYIDSKYNIAGMELTQPGFENRGEVHFYNLIENGNFAFESNIAAMLTGSENSKIVGSGTVNGGKTTGTYTLQVENADFLNVHVQNLDITLPFVELGLQITQGENNFELKLLSASTTLVGISLWITDSNGPALNVPSNTVDGMDSSAMQQWAENLDLENLLNNLEAAGVPSELIDALTGAMSAPPQYAEPEYGWEY